MINFSALEVRGKTSVSIIFACLYILHKERVEFDVTLSFEKGTIQGKLADTI